MDEQIVIGEYRTQGVEIWTLGMDTASNYRWAQVEPGRYPLTATIRRSLDGSARVVMLSVRAPAKVVRSVIIGSGGRERDPLLGQSIEAVKLLREYNPEPWWVITDPRVGIEPTGDFRFLTWTE